MADPPPPPPPPPAGMASGYTLSACIWITSFLLLIGTFLLILWLLYRPYKPQFSVESAGVYSINTTELQGRGDKVVISVDMLFTIHIINPNKHVSMYCDKLFTFLSYKNRTITQQVIMMPSLYLENNRAMSVSRAILGTPVPFSYELAKELSIDFHHGVVGVQLVVLGWLRWKAGPIRTAKYELYVKCDISIAWKEGTFGPNPSMGAEVCNVDVRK